MFVFGVVLLLDVALPTRTEPLRVDRHTSNNAGARIDTSYALHFVGGQLGSCSVGYAAYTKLKDGDAVVVQSTKLLKNCLRITQDEVVVESNRYWKLFALFGACALILGASGWIKSTEERGVQLF